VTTFIAPFAALKNSIARADYSRVMYRQPQQQPALAHIAIRKIEIPAETKPTPGQPVEIAALYLPEPHQGGNRRDHRVLAADRTPQARPFMHWAFQTREFSYDRENNKYLWTPDGYTSWTLKSSPGRDYRTHVTDKAGLRRHRPGGQNA